jgi:large subunit ribosomal protein L32
MAQPKHKTSKSKKRLRRASHSRPLPKVAVCNACGEPALPHRICSACGQYNGRQVLTVTGDE